MDFCRIFIAKDGDGNQVEVPVLLLQKTESGELVFPQGREPQPDKPLPEAHDVAGPAPAAAAGHPVILPA